VWPKPRGFSFRERSSLPFALTSPVSRLLPRNRVLCQNSDNCQLAFLDGFWMALAVLAVFGRFWSFWPFGHFGSFWGFSTSLFLQLYKIDFLQ
jgi:hypothetical protein